MSMNMSMTQLLNACKKMLSLVLVCSMRLWSLWWESKLALALRQADIAIYYMLCRYSREVEAGCRLELCSEGLWDSNSRLFLHGGRNISL